VRSSGFGCRKKVALLEGPVLGADRNTPRVSISLSVGKYNKHRKQLDLGWFFSAPCPATTNPATPSSKRQAHTEIEPERRSSARVGGGHTDRATLWLGPAGQPIFESYAPMVNQAVTGISGARLASPPAEDRGEERRQPGHAAHIGRRERPGIGMGPPRAPGHCCTTRQGRKNSASSVDKSPILNPSSTRPGATLDRGPAQPTRR